MSRIQPQALSNRELILACENEWTMGGLPSELQLELFKRFSALVHFEGFPAKDPRQLELPL